jgi:hypothetical protein
MAAVECKICGKELSIEEIEQGMGAHLKDPVDNPNYRSSPNGICSGQLICTYPCCGAVEMDIDFWGPGHACVHRACKLTNLNNL